MKITESQMREVIRECLLNENISADAIHQKFPFIGEDSVKLLTQFIWRFAADIAKQKSSGDQNAAGQATQEIGMDTMMSLGATIKDLVQHFLPNTVAPQKKLPPPPPSSTGPRPQVQKQQQQEGDEIEVDEGHYSSWPLGK